MLDHISIGVRDIARSRRFYDAALKPLGYSCQSAGASSLGYGAAGTTGLWIAASGHPVVAHDQSNLHFCFTAPTPQSVDQFHRAALQHGGRDNGAPGLRAEYGSGYYAAYVIDPDGYRLEVHCEKA